MLYSDQPFSLSGRLLGGFVGVMLPGVAPNPNLSLPIALCRIADGCWGLADALS